MADTFIAAARVAKICGDALKAYVISNPKSTAFTVITAALTPILGPSWLLVLLLKALGFGSLGPVAGQRLVC